MKKDIESKTYHSRWRGTELQSKYRNSREEFSSMKYSVIKYSSFLCVLAGMTWFFIAPGVLGEFGLGPDATGVGLWLGIVSVLTIFALFNPLESKLPSYETRIFWRICETLENLDLYWESWHGSKPREIFLDRANKKFRKALSNMGEIIPPHMKNAKIIEKQIRVPLKALRKTLRQKLLPMQSAPTKGISRIYNRLEELAVIFYEHDLAKLLEFDKSLEGIQKSDIKKIDIRAMFSSLWRGKIGKFIISLGLGNVLSLSLFFIYCSFSIEKFLQIFQDPIGIANVSGAGVLITVAIWEALTRA